LEELDLHKISHEEAKIIIEEFILKHYKKLPVQIITGNSMKMQNILNSIVKIHNLRVVPSHPKNLGSYIITEQL